VFETCGGRSTFTLRTFRKPCSISKRTFGEATLSFSVNHWASKDDCSSDDEGLWLSDVLTWDMLLPWDQDHEDRDKGEYLRVRDRW